MNSTVHMLEALTSVYRIWPDPKVKARLRELFEIVRDKMVRDPGYLVQFFTTDWQPKANDDSYGHDVEVAYLLTEAAEALEHSQRSGNLGSGQEIGRSRHAGWLG